jgi:pimeloyl-ACP methyl ester carboxylesterase
MNSAAAQKQLVVHDLLLTYYQVGEIPSEKILLFLHGWRSNSTLWFQLFPALKEAGYSILALDFPGFGKSQMPKQALFLQNYVDIVAEFMHKLGINKAAVIGHSHGGRVAIKLAAEQPERIEKLVLVDSSGIKTETMQKSMKKTVSKTLKPLFKPSFMQPLRRKVYQLMGAEDYVATPELTQTFVNIINEDLKPQLAHIKSDTLLLWGKEDKDTPIQDAEIMKASIPHATLIALEEAGHYSFLDKKEEFEQALLDFLKK